MLDNINFCFSESNIRHKAWVVSKPKEEQTAHQIRYVFELLLQENPRFGRFRTRGSLAFAQKRGAIWSQDLKSRNKRDVIISKIIERSRNDPDFREELLDCPPKALSFLPNDALQDLGLVRFVETDQIAPVVLDEEAGDLVVYLDRPAWERRADENTLDKMLRE